ncbi:hypothetical protein [Streptomyces sp. TRM49041]|uniref:hypothetical protein n=1 Tax=Streptomyces sp. TRM49041 TaxID=2603216 RepID=UPI0011EBF40F|nr:hypothetical protein [Streptomyces sp. TRM49041]
MSTPDNVMKFRARYEHIHGWGLFLLFVAAVLWFWFAVLLFLPYSIEGSYGTSTTCESRFSVEDLDRDRLICVDERNWPELLAVLGSSVPVSVVGACLYAVGKTNVQMSEHAESLARRIKADLKDQAQAHVKDEKDPVQAVASGSADGTNGTNGTNGTDGTDGTPSHTGL